MLIKLVKPNYKTKNLSVVQLPKSNYFHYGNILPDFFFLHLRTFLNVVILYTVLSILSPSKKKKIMCTSLCN